MAFEVNSRDHVPLLLHTLCDRGPNLQPDNLIVTKTSNGYSTLTFQNHQVRSLQLASALSKWGVRVGDCVGTLLWNTSWHMQCYHAISCMGAILHTLNLRLGPKDLGYIIHHAGDRLIIADADLLDLLSKVEPDMLRGVEQLVCCGLDGTPNNWTLPPSLSSIQATDYDVFLHTGTATFRWPEIPETSLHALCYTSGTTGNPKGAAYSQRSTYLHTLASVGADQLGIRGSDVILPFVPMFHVLGWGVPYMALMLGTRMVFTGKMMDPDTLLDAMIDWKVHFSNGVPTVWQGVRAAIEARGVEKVKEHLHLRMLTCGGSAPPKDMMAWFLEKLGVEFLQGWGMTETNPLGTLGRRIVKHKDLGKTTMESFENITKAGLPLPGVQVRIANAEDLDKDMPHGDVGELLVRGPWIISSYFKTSAPDKFHNGWLITGDVAKIDEEGAVIISDRSKDVIKSGGEWISSIDLENHITSMSGIAMAAVVAVPHPKWDERPVAIVTLAPGNSSSSDKKAIVESVATHCLTAFAKFQLPDDVLVWEQIPLTSTGKIDKKVIRERLKKEGYTLPTASPSSKL